MTRLHDSLALAMFIALITVPVPSGRADPPQPGFACLQTPFRGITETSETGEITGFSDPLDWGCVSGPDGAARAMDTPPLPPPPEGVCLYPAAPNPATTAVRLRLSLGESNHVRLVVHGQAWRGGPREVFPVRTLLDASLQAGEHAIIWDARNDAGERVTPGVYRVVAEVGAHVLCGDIEVR
jgi:hypothetical protein